MTVHYIALDIHCGFSEMAVVTGAGKLIRRDRCDTRTPALREAITQVRRPRRLTFEEGPLADWLARELRSSVDELVVCEPRRNHWIARDGDKDDPLDARKLADLYRGGYLKAVHQSRSLGRSLLKQQVSLYHDRVGGRTFLDVTPAVGAYNVWFCMLTARNRLDISVSKWNTSPIDGKVGSAIGLNSLSVTEKTL